MRRWSTGDRRSASRRWPSGQPAPLWAASHYLDTHRDPRVDNGTQSPTAGLEGVPEPRRPLDAAPDGERTEYVVAPAGEYDPNSGGAEADSPNDDPDGPGPRREAPLGVGRADAGGRRGRHRADQAGVPVARLLDRDRDVTAPSWAAVLGTPERPGRSERLRETLVLGRYRALADDETGPTAPAESGPPRRPGAPLEPLTPLYPARRVSARTGSRREALRSGVLLVVMLLAGSVIGYHVLMSSSAVTPLPPADTSPYGATGALPGSLSVPLPDIAPGQAPQEADLPPTAGLSGIPATVLAAYHAAETHLAATAPGCRLSWSLLAGIGKIESDHARGGQVDTTGTTLHPILGPVLDGTGGNAAITDTDGGRLDGDTVHDRAVGPMQFLPGTWATWGIDASGDGRADPNNTADAATAAGRYLCAGSLDTSTVSGAHDAVFRYNHSETYVAHVLAWARAYATGTIPTPDNPTGDTTDPLTGPNTSEPSNNGPSSGGTGSTSGPDVLAAGPTAPGAAASPAAPAAAAPPALASGETQVPITGEPTTPPMAAASPGTPSARSTPASTSFPASAISSPPATTTTAAPIETTLSVPAITPSATTRPRSATPPTSTHTSGATTSTTATPCPTTTVTSAIGVTASVCAPVLGAPSPIAVTAPATPTSTTTPTSSATPTSSPTPPSTTAPTAPRSSAPGPRPHPHTTAAGASSTPSADGTPSPAAGGSLDGPAEAGTPVTSGASGGGSTLDTTTTGIRALLGDIQTEGAPQPTLITTPAGPGLRFALPGGGRRSEVIPPLAEYRDGQQMWLHYRAQLAGVPVDTNTWQLIAQFHHDGNTGSPPIALEVGHGRLRLANQGAHQQDLGPISSDGLVDVVLHVVFSRDPARGQVDVWRDGAAVLTGYHPPGGTLLDGADYLKLGLYRDPAITQPSSVTVLAVQARPTPIPTNASGS